MSLVNYAGFESAAGVEALTTSNVTYSTSVVNSGLYSLRCNPTGINGAKYVLGGISVAGAVVGLNLNTVGFSVQFRYDTKPASGDEEIISVASSTAGTSQSFTIRLNSAGQLVAYDRNQTLVQTGTTVLSASTFYRISGLVTYSATGSYTVSINGSVELSGTADTNTTFNFASIALGKVTNRNGNTVDFYYDDLVIDSTTEPISYSIGAIHPAANGSTMQWTNGTGASNYTQVNEVVPDDTTYVMSTGTAGDLALFSNQTMAAAGLTGVTIIAVKANIRVREDTSTTSSNVVRIKSGATNSSSSARDLTTSVSTSSRLLTTDPNTGSAWMESGVNALEFGSLENNAVAVRMTYGAVMVLYTNSPTPPVSGGSTLSLMGV